MIYVLVIGLFQSLVALLLIFTSGKLRKNEKHIAIFLLFALLHFLSKFSLLTIFKNDYLFYNLVNCFAMGYGPSVYTYVKKYYKIKSSTHDKIHWIPLYVASLVYLFIIVSVLFFNVDGYIKSIETYKKVMDISFSVSVVFYGVNICIIAYKNQNVYKGFEWKRLFFVGLLIATPTLILVPLSIGNVFHNELMSRMFVYSILIIITVLLIQHLYIINKKDEWIKEKKKAKGKYYNSSIKYSDLEIMAEKLNTYMLDKKPWLDEHVTLDRLSEHFGMSKHHITQVCNNYFNKNFYQYVNEFRVERAKEMIKSSKNKMSLVDIAHDCGFSSKSSFNRHFKLLTDQTPSAFRKLNENSSQTRITQ